MRKWILCAVILFMLALMTACSAAYTRVRLHYADGREETVQVSSLDALQTLLGRAYVQDGDEEGYAYSWFDGEDQRLETLEQIPGAMYERYAPVSVNVKLDSRDGSVEPSEVRVVYQSVYGDLPTPVRDGWRFDGWFTEEVGGERISADSVCERTEDHTLYAAWVKQETYTLLLSANFGDEQPVRVELNVGEETVLPENPFERENYVFTGWNTKPDGSGEEYPDGASVLNLAPAGGELALYALWSGNTVTVNLDPQGGELGAVSVQAEPGGLYGELPVPERAGYAFAGWAFDPDGEQMLDGDTSVVKSEPHTLYAVWTEGGFTVVFHPNGGSGSMASISGEPGVGTTLPANGFTREGFVFEGWAETGGGAVAYADGAVYTASEPGSYTLYAVWGTASAQRTVTVSFNANGGAVQTASVSLESGAAYGTLPVPVREGYAFDGWYTSASGGSLVTGNTAVAGSDHTLYAHWSAESSASTGEEEAFRYTIQYNANGGSGSTPASQHVNGTPSALSANQFTREGYSFAGWTTQADGSGLFFADGEQVDGLGISDGDTITLYAVWE